MHKTAIALSLGALVASTNSLADSDHNLAGHGSSSHAPIGVMGDHLHAKGEWMLSLRAMNMEMEGLLEDRDSVNAEDVIKGGEYMMAPTKMTMRGYMLGGMFAPTDNVTMMAMLPYREKSMDMVMRHMMPGAMPGMMMSHTMMMDMETSGWGDLSVGALVRGWESRNHSLHWNLGLSLPTGSIDEKNNGVIMPYAMQLGSGTWDAKLGATYNGHNAGRISWGGQLLATVRSGENDYDYRLGNEYEANAWAAYSLHPAVSLSARLKGLSWDEIKGEDPELAMNMSTTADTANSGGERIDAIVGINTLVTGGPLQGHRFAIEYGVPVMQDLNGIQMETDSTLTVGWQLAL
jgi:hypothetical protein